MAQLAGQNLRRQYLVRQATLIGNHSIADKIQVHLVLIKRLQNSVGDKMHHMNEPW